MQLCDNIHDFLVNMELAESRIAQTESQEIENEIDRIYVLNDGTQIRASQIHFDNDDPQVDLTKENIPFIKYTTDIVDENDSRNVSDKDTKLLKIVDSPDKTFGDNPSNSFANGLPFRPISNNYEAKFTKWIPSSSRGSVWWEKNQENTNEYTQYSNREEILEMLKDSALDIKPYDDKCEQPGVKRKHARKSNPTKLEPICRLKRLTNINETRTPKIDNQYCNFCGVLIENDMQKIALFDKGCTEKILNINTLNASLAQLKKHAPIKTICVHCLDDNFIPSQSSNAPNDQNRLLDPDEYIVISNNQQYVYRKTKNVASKTIPNSKEDMNNNSFGKSVENVSIDNLAKDLAQAAEELRNKLQQNKDNVTEEMENDEGYIVRDERVLRLLDKSKKGDHSIELKCRFCNRVFASISELDSHASEHCLTIDDEQLFPCPLCDYGYADLICLRTHLKSAHDTDSVPGQDENYCMENDAECSGEITDKANKNIEGLESIGEVKTEVKVEVNESSDEEGLWIVQTMDDGGDDGLVNLLRGAAAISHGDKNSKDRSDEAAYNSDTITSKAAGSSERCGQFKSGRGSKHSMSHSRKSKTDRPDSQVTCHDCNEKFTSKVRLRFHLQFHASPPSTQLMADGRFACPACPGCTFDTDSQLFDHVHFQHTRERYWKCRVHGCGKSFHLKATLTKHGRAHTDTRRYICDDCGKRFLDKQTLDEHGVTHLKIKPYKCHICLKQLTRRSRLRMHLRAHLEEPSPRLVMVCRLCAQAFRDHTAAQDHITSSPACVQELASQLKQKPQQLSPSSGLVTRTSASPRAPPQIKWQVESAEASQLMNRLTGDARALVTVVEIDKALRCEFCELVFYTEEGLNKHRAIHKGVPNPYICHICKVSFSTYSRCTTHKTTHGFFKRPVSRQAEYNSPVLGYSDFPVVKHFLCEVCGRSYLHWTYLQVHRRNKHPPRGIQLTCQKCQLTFANSWGLTNHKKSAQCTSDQDDSCVVYETGDDDVKQYEYEDNSSSGVREGYRIKCRDCEAVLPSKTELYRHRNKEHCDQSLSLHDTTDASQTSTESQRLPTKQWCRPRTWPCDQCSRRFRVRADLRTHLRTHHPDLIHVIQVSGNTVRPQQAMTALLRHGVSVQRVRGVSAISYGKGSTGIIPDSSRALTRLGPGVALPFAMRRPRPHNHQKSDAESSL